MSKPKTIIIEKSDWMRGLLSDTTPAEIPILISNDGFYLNMKLRKFPAALSVLVEAFLTSTEAKQPSIPFSYKISKDETSLRRLGLPHPRSQLEVVSFYEKYYPLIPHYCNRGNFSIRRPYQLASHYYTSGANEDAFAYRSQTIEIDSKDKSAKHPVSMFSYRSFRRLHQFFDSSKFSDLEIKYSHMASIDISKCFDSIYTHSIAWATKSKMEAKRATTVETFGGSFDRLMQLMNHNETNGIVIGPEVSRIFAEIILDRVDVDVESRISRTPVEDGGKGYIRGLQYDIFRYVDNVYIFFNNERVRKDITAAIEDCLDEYKMSLNKSKSEVFKRPFFTKKSMAISEAKHIRDTFFDAAIDTTWLNGRRVSGIKPQLSAIPSLQDFSNSLRRACFMAESDYSSISGFLIASLRSRMQRVLSSTNDYELFLIEQDRGHEADIRAEYQRRLVAYVSSCVDMCMHMYTLAPSVPSSLDLATIMILSADTLKGIDFDHFLHIQERLQFWVSKLMTSASIVALVDNDLAVPIEVLNVLCALTAFDFDTKHIEEVIANSVGMDRQSNYFEIVTKLFVLSRMKGSERAIGAVFKSAKEKVLKDVDLRLYSESTHLLLDLLSCPHVSRAERRKLYRGMIEKFNTEMQGPEQSGPSLFSKATNAEIEEALAHMEKNPWFVDWHKIDLLRLIEKKRLRSGYS